MNRHFWIITTIILVLFSVAIPANTAQARGFSFGQAPAAWQVTVKACQNGFTVTATGGTNPSSITAVRALEAKLLLPNLKPPFIRMTRPLPFTSARGSTIVAIAANPDVKVTGTAPFFFGETLAVGSLIETTLDAYINE